MCFVHIGCSCGLTHSSSPTCTIMKKFVFLTFVLFIATIAVASTPKSAAIQAYVEQHHEIAVKEMKRSGIPASILLAHAILSSQNGLSDLVAENNNHFAIKCGHGWKGDTVFKNKDQEITEECFRAYPNASASFSDYTDLMMEDKTCRSLFQHSYYDYKSWAEGMQECLHKSDKHYAEALVKLIDKFDLDKYDSPAIFSPVVQKPIIGYEFEIN